MEAKKVAVAGVLILVIVVAAVMAYHRTSNKVTPPQWMLEKPWSKMDIKTLEVSTEPLGLWLGKYAADSSGLFKSPKTGEYTMSDIATCVYCGKQIPAPPIPASVERMEQPARGLARDKIYEEYACPCCKKKHPCGQ